MEIINSDLKLLSVLMPLEDYNLIINTIKQKTLSRDDLAQVGDIIISSYRRYC